MTRKVSEKMGIKDGQSVGLVDAPADAVAAMELPDDIRLVRGKSKADHAILFATAQADLDRQFPRLRERLLPEGKLWVAWPKANQLGTDLDIKAVIRIGYGHSMVESTNLRIDDTWTALKFTHPKEGKEYRNSYGTLPGQRE